MAMLPCEIGLSGGSINDLEETGQFLSRTAPSKQNSAVKSLKCMSERSVLDSGNYCFLVKSIFLKTSSSTPMLTDFFLTYFSFTAFW